MQQCEVSINKPKHAAAETNKAFNAQHQQTHRKKVAIVVDGG